MSNNKCKSDDLKQLVTLITLNSVKEIIDNSKDCLNITYNGEFSIFIAAKHNDIEIIQLLESKEANIFNKNDNFIKIIIIITKNGLKNDMLYLIFIFYLSFPKNKIYEKRWENYKFMLFF